jgi:hypothetical protein
MLITNRLCRRSHPLRQSVGRGLQIARFWRVIRKVPAREIVLGWPLLANLPESRLDPDSSPTDLREVSHLSPVPIPNQKPPPAQIPQPSLNWCAYVAWWMEIRCC